MSTATADPIAGTGGAATDAGLATYLVVVEVVSDGNRRNVAVACAAESGGAAAQIAVDVNEDERHVHLKSVFPIADLQIIPPLAWHERTGLVSEPE